MRVQVTAVLALLLLGATGCTTSAPAAGAWVLWVGLAGGDWAPYGGYDSLKDCEAQARAIAAREAEKRRALEKTLESPYPGAQNLGSVMSQMADRMAPRLACLPDTVDPRAPKRN